MHKPQIKPSATDIRIHPTGQRHNVVYCRRSGVRFEIIDNFGLEYVAESGQVHPIFQSRDSLRAILKLEYAKARKQATGSRLFTPDWQDISQGKLSDFKYKKDDQILSKSFIAGVVLSQLWELDLVVCKELNGRQLHELNISLCKHRPRANLIWMARRMLVFPATGAMRINLDTVYQEYKEYQHKTKHWSDALASYIEAMLEDEEERLPKLKGTKKTSIRIYDSHLPAKQRLKNIDKPLNGKRVDSILTKASKIIKVLRKADVINKRQESTIYTAMLNWPELSEEGLTRLGDRLTDLSETSSLSSDNQQILWKVGLSFSTGEIKMVGNAANYTLGEVFLGDIQETPDAAPIDLMARLKAKVAKNERKE